RSRRARRLRRRRASSRPGAAQNAWSRPQSRARAFRPARAVGLARRVPRTHGQRTAVRLGAGTIRAAVKPPTRPAAVRYIAVAHVLLVSVPAVIPWTRARSQTAKLR